MRFFSAQNFYHKAFPHRKKILVCIGACWLLLLYTLYGLPVQKSSTAFFPDNSPTLQSMIKAMDMASFAQYIYVDFSAKELSIKELANHVEQVKNRLNPNLLKPASISPPIEPDDILSLIPSLFDDEMQQEIKERIADNHIKQSAKNAEALLLGLSTTEAIKWIRHDPLALRELILNKLPKTQNFPPIDPRYGFALSKDQEHLLLILSPQKSVHQTDFALATMQNLEQALQELPSNIKASIIGGVRHTAANTKAIDADIWWISIASLLGIALIYAFFIRSWGGFWLLLTPCLAVSLALGMVHLFFGMVSGLALGFGMSILGIAEDYAVHMHFALRSNKDKNTVFHALSTPLFQGVVLNASGFILLLFSAIPAVRQLSAFAIVALGSGFLLALYILPLCKGFDRPVFEQNTNQQEPSLFPKLALTIGLSLVLGIFCCIVFFKLPIDISPQSMGANMQEIQSDTKAFSKTWQFNAPNLILIDAQNSTKALEKTQHIQSMLQKSLPDVHTSSLVNLLPTQQIITENIKRWDTFMHEHRAHILNSFQGNSLAFDTAEIFAPFFGFLATPPKPISLNVLQQDPFKELVSTLFQYYPSDKSIQSRIIISDKLTQNDIPPEIANEVTFFTTQVLEKNLRAVFFTEAKFLPIMFIICFGLLFICFRNIGQASLAAMPALAALFCIFLTMFLWQKPLTLASLAAMPLVLGLSIDHGIMATHHLAKGIPLQINRAILVSSLTACVSMGMLAFAAHPALQAMGHVIFVGLLVEMPVSMWLLPRLCK